MGMRQDDFWSQSLTEWDARVHGFMELHGGGGDDGETFTDADMKELDARVAAERAASPLIDAAPG
jgi:hypothetical protein